MASSAEPLSRRWLVVGGLCLLSVAGAFGLAAFLAKPAPEPVALAPVAPGPDQAALAAEIARLESQLRQKPDRIDDWKALGRGYARAGRYMEAVSAFLEAEKIDPRDPEVRAALGELADIARRSGRHEDAIQGR